MKLMSYLEKQSNTSLLVMGVLLVILLGIVNYQSGPDVSFLIFYLVPVFLAAWFVGRWAGVAMTIASGLSWLVVARLTVEHYTNPVIPYWNGLTRFAFILFMTFIVSSLKRALEHERELARTDYLTGAVNGRAFSEATRLEIQRARRYAHPFTLAYMDVDDFKLVNDRFGHSTGDMLLRAVADSIRRTVRSIDVVARLGGDEFAVLLPETDEDAAEVVIRRVRRQLLDTARQHRWPVTFSIGVVTWSEPPESVDEVLKAADRLMYSAKSSGKNSITHKLVDASADAA